jgi:HAD superfamily hydrolase (TIGR01509 family)
MGERRPAPVGQASMEGACGKRHVSLWPFDHDAAIFDFDGTLADTSFVWHEVDRRFFAKRAIPYPGDLDAALAPLSFERCAAYVIDRFGLDERVEDVCAEWNATGAELYAAGIELRKGAIDYVRALHEAGVRCALATTNASRVLAPVLERSGLGELLDAAVFGDVVPVSKDKPDIYLAAAARLGAKPSDCVVFDDIVQGIRSAHGAGMATCAVATGDTEAAEREKMMAADVYLGSWEDISIS